MRRLICGLYQGARWWEVPLIFYSISPRDARKLKYDEVEVISLGKSCDPSIANALVAMQIIITYFCYISTSYVLYTGEIK